MGGGGTGKRTFPPAVELDRDALVHVLLQVQDVLLLGPLLLALPCYPCSRCCSSSSCCCAPTCPSSATAPRSSAAPAAVRSVCHFGFVWLFLFFVGYFFVFSEFKTYPCASGKGGGCLMAAEGVVSGGGLLVFRSLWEVPFGFGGARVA